MAEVFVGELAGELGFVRKIAIKRMLPELAENADAARRFLDEARIASRLHHANIVAVLDVGLLDGVPFQVLELVDGIDAMNLIRRCGGALPVEIALAIAGDVAHALAHAHAATDAEGTPLDIVHRDVTPSNILVSWEGDVKLTDFGIAVARGREARTQAGHVTGTYGFMSPEQRLRGVVGAQSDVYALALTLHALIAGESPIRDAAGELRSMSGEPLALADAIPDDVRALLDRVLVLDRRARPSAEQLADELGRLAAARSSRDRRSVLREFLAPLRGVPRARGALDALLGLEMIAVPPDPADAIASEQPTRYELRGDKTRSLRAAGSAPPRAPARRVRPIVLATALVALGATGLVAWRVAARDEPREPGEPRETALAQPVAPTPTPSPTRAPAPATVASHEPATVLADGAPPRRRPPAPAARPAARAPRADTAARPPDPVSPAGTGYLQVVGEEVLGAKVLVDDRPQGYAPAKLAVPWGHHVIVVEKRDGSRLPAREVEITERETLGHPKRLAW